MSNVVPFDTLALAQALRDEAGYDQKQAEGTAKVFARLLVADLVTKDDFRAGMAAGKTDLEREATLIRSDFKSTTETLRVELEAKIETTVSAAKVDIIKWLFGTIVAQTGLIIAAVKLLH